MKYLVSELSRRSACRKQTEGRAVQAKEDKLKYQLQRTDLLEGSHQTWRTLKLRPSEEWWEPFFGPHRRQQQR
jgi:hypothetical protein